MADKPDVVKALEEEIEEETARGDPQENHSEPVENPAPPIDQIPILDTFDPVGRPAREVKPHVEVDPSPKLSNAYPAVKLKNYERKKGF